MNTKVAFTLLIGWVMMACTPTVSNKAQNLLDRATSHYSNHQFASAKLLLDSIHQQFPTEISIRKQAQNLMYHIEQQEEWRNVAYYDSILPLVEEQVAQYAAHFVLPDTVYQSEKTYLHKTFHKQTPATGLYCEVNQQGVMSLVSVYSGAVLNHVCIKVSNKEVYAATDTVSLDDVDNYRFTDLGIRWEYVTFDASKQQEVLGFIAAYASTPLQVTLFGKRPYVYYLPQRTAQAIAESVQFAAQKAFLYQLQQSYKKSKNKLLWLEQKITASDSLSVL